MAARRRCGACSDMAERPRCCSAAYSRSARVYAPALCPKPATLRKTMLRPRAIALPRRLKSPQPLLQQRNNLRYGGFARLDAFSRALKLKDPDMPKLRCDRHIRWVAGQPRATDPVLDDIHRPRHNPENARLAVPTAGINELSRDAHPVSCLAHTAFEHVAHPQLVSDL